MANLSKKVKLKEKIKNNPKNVSFEVLKKLLISEGFTLKGANGSHHTFAKSGYKNIVLPLHKPMKEIYVKEVLKALTRGENEK